MRVIEDSEKVSLKLNIIKEKKNEDHGIWPHDFMANRRGKVETVVDFLSDRGLSWALKSLQMVTAAMKL